ncbi:MAG: DMT family transporter [Hyphomonadaceae bacterium]|nr:DMT family transporter [Hyphomonadaceae bacterium]
MKLTASPVLTLVVGIATMSLMDATIKYLGQHNHALLVTLGRYAFGALFAIPIWLRAGAPRITAEMWRAHTFRGLFIAASASAFFWSLAILPLVEAVTLAFVAPLIVPFTAALLIGEPVRLSSVAAIAGGFVGVVVAVQGAPPIAQSPQHALGVAAVLFAAVTFAISMTLMRARAMADGAAIVGLLATIIPGALVAIPAILVSAPPHLGDLPWFVLVGAFAAAGMYLMARAYAGAEAQKLAPVHYSELIWATAIGYFIFHETPRPQVYAGAAFIIAACLYTVWDERRGAPPPETNA